LREIRVAIGLGSNLGNRLEHLQFGIRRMRDALSGMQVSPVYETSPELVEKQRDFLNACCTGSTRLTPHQLLSQLGDIERAAGRVRGGPRYGPRILDLDLLLCGERVVESLELIVPHPRMRERAFVLVPLSEIAGDWIVPASHGGDVETVESLAARVGDGGIRRVGELDAG